MLKSEEVSNFSPEMAVPMTVKIPEPMTAPMPRAVSEPGPRVLRRLCSGSSDSRISLSIDFLANSWDRCVLPQAAVSTASEGKLTGRDGDAISERAAAARSVPRLRNPARLLLAECKG